MLSDQLSTRYGRGFTKTNLFRMIRFTETVPNRQKVHSLSGQLSWLHFRSIFSIEDPLARGFYTEMCRLERWRDEVFFNSMFEFHGYTGNFSKPVEFHGFKIRVVEMFPDAGKFT